MRRAPMNEFAHRIAVDWHKTLEQILELAAKAGSKGVLVFDLDSTVFDNRPRQARILREYGVQKNVPALTKCQDFHFNNNGWDLKLACIAAGVSPEETESIFRDLKAFWGARFFTSPYCRDDIEIVGAPRYLNACVKTGARVVYVTGRHEEMRAGSIEAMARCGMPVPGGAVTLLMKPTLRETDDGYKRVAHQQLAAMGQVLAAFDNELTHVNDYAARFPEAIPVHLATDHSGRPVTLADRVISIPHFAW